MGRERIAIVGSGISGLAALWTLRNSDSDIHLFEKEDRLGGHTNTATWTHNGQTTPVDTGFIVLNTATYPNFIEFLKAIHVKTMASQMTFGISRDAGAFEWSGTSGTSLFAQPENALKPSFWRMIFDIVRFNQFALNLLSKSPANSHLSDMSIGEYLEMEGYSAAFRDDYLIPMTACVWSTGADKCALEFPALTLVRFMWNHHLLSTISERPAWLTISGGSKRYIDAVTQDCSTSKIHLSTPVSSVTTQGQQVRLQIGGTSAGRTEIFDQVILACHGDQAHVLLGDAATHEEREILCAFETSLNIAYLHSDLNLMPKRRTAWSAWNYLTTSGTTQSPGEIQSVSLTYNMNILQAIPTETFSHILVTLNPKSPPSPSHTQAVYEYRHPLYNARMVAAQEKLDLIQGKRGIWFAGAWTGYGFHEDGFSSGMRIGLKLGGSVPWRPKDAKFARGVGPILTWKNYLVRAVLMLLQLWIGVLKRVVKIRATVQREINGYSHGSSEKDKEL